MHKTTYSILKHCKLSRKTQTDKLGDAYLLVS